MSFEMWWKKNEINVVGVLFNPNAEAGSLLRLFKKCWMDSRAEIAPFPGEDEEAGNAENKD